MGDAFNICLIFVCVMLLILFWYLFDICLGDVFDICLVFVCIMYTDVQYFFGSKLD